MQRAKQIAEEIHLEYTQKPQKKRAPRFVILGADRGVGESYHASYDSGVIHLEAQGPLGAAYGMHNLTTGIASGHLAEFLGTQVPRFPLRPLWIGCDDEAKVSAEVGIPFPSVWRRDPTAVERCCRCVVSLGYNALILGGRDGSQSTPYDMEATLAVIRDFGLKVIVKPRLFAKDLVRCPLDATYREKIQANLQQVTAVVSGADFIFCESASLHADFNKHKKARDATHYELVLAEVEMLEAGLNGKLPLIYYMPARDTAATARQATWLPTLCDDVGKDTIIAFPAVAGEVSADHLPHHPFWDALRASPDFSATRLLPVVNGGGLRQGEGLWPALTCDLVERFITRCTRHPFAGAVIMTNKLPTAGSLLHCNLWVAAQSMWSEKAPHLLVETWFKAFRPDVDYTTLAAPLRQLRGVALQLSMLRWLTGEKGRETISTEECRAVSESLLSQVNHLQGVFAREEKTRAKRGERPSMHDYFGGFSRDAQRIILHFLHYFNIPSVHGLAADDMQDGVWTQAVSGGGQGVRSGAKVIFLDHPAKGASGSRMEMIYHENRLL